MVNIRLLVLPWASSLLLLDMVSRGPSGRHGSAGASATVTQGNESGRTTVIE